MSKKSIVQGAFILTAAGIITRILGFVYRVYMSNLIGAEGMGLYQLIMPIYSLCWSIACSGFTTTISKLTAQEKAKGEYGNINRVLKFAMLMSGAIGLILGLLLFLTAGQISILIIRDDRVTLALRILSLAIPFMACGSCFRGYFFGLQEAMVPAVNQVLEQSVRMIVIFALAGFFVPLGLTYACALAVIGIVAEEVISFLYAFICFQRYRSGKKKMKVKKASLRTATACRLIVFMALPLTLNRVTGSLLSTVENMLIPQRLQAFGMVPGDAMALYGQISGMAMPLIYFPSAFLTALSISLVPSISEDYALNRTNRINQTVCKTMLFTNIIGIGAAGLFITFADQLGWLIYNQDIGRMLVGLGAMCPFLYLQMTLSGILNGLGFQVFIFRNSLLSSAINLIFIYFLVPLKGMDAFIMGWFVSLLVVTTLELDKIQKSVEVKIAVVDWFVKPLLSILAGCLVFNLVAKKYLFQIFGATWGLILAIGALMVFYMAFILLTGCLTWDDILGLLKTVKPQKHVQPKGEL